MVVVEFEVGKILAAAVAVVVVAVVGIVITEVL